MDERKCPHHNIVHCPLYLASHEGQGFGCDDGRLEPWGGCAVDRGADYGAMVAKYAAVNPQAVAECAFMEAEEARKQQRARNMRAAGVH